MVFNNPISSEKADRLLRLLELNPSNHILDAGCGQGEFLIRVLEVYNCAGLGIDVDEPSLKTARSTAEARLDHPKHCEFRKTDLTSTKLDPDSFDLAICLGATHAFGRGDEAYPNTVRELTRLVRPGGRMLIGEGYWKQPPALEYLELLGEPVGIYRSHAENVAFGEQCGLRPLHASVSSDDEWDDFEWEHRRALEKELSLHPEDSKTGKELERIRRWSEGYLRWGRSTMGFGFYLFGLPD
ncbi:MAG: class I SAM-dependent methyltransferase [Verrucomicrobiota bacterium]